MDTYLEQMKSDYDQFVDGLDASYLKLHLYVRQRRAKKRDLLKRSGEAETCSRYLCEGFVGLYLDEEASTNLTQIFMATDVAFDSESYLNRSKTASYLKCLSDIVYFELSASAELVLVANHPEFIKLALAVNHRLLSRIAERSRVKNKGISNGYAEFLKSMPGIEGLLTQSDLASYFNCSSRTVRSVVKEYKSDKR